MVTPYDLTRVSDGGVEGRWWSSAAGLADRCPSFFQQGSHQVGGPPAGPNFSMRPWLWPRRFPANDASEKAWRRGVTGGGQAAEIADVGRSCTRAQIHAAGHPAGVAVRLLADRTMRRRLFPGTIRKKGVKFAVGLTARQKQGGMATCGVSRSPLPRGICRGNLGFSRLIPENMRAPVFCSPVARNWPSAPSSRIPCWPRGRNSSRLAPLPVAAAVAGWPDQRPVRLPGFCSPALRLRAP